MKVVIKNIVYEIMAVVCMVVFRLTSKQITGLKYPVKVFLKSERYMSIGSVNKEEVRRALRMTGGCMVQFITFSMVEEAYKNKLVPEWAYKLSKYIPDYYQVIICKESVAEMSKQEIKAIYLHELGHLVNGDLHKENPNRVGNFIIEESYEFAADDHAVNIVGKSVMKSALQKLFDNIREYLVEQNMLELLKDFNHHHNDENSIDYKRLARLS